MWILLLQRFTDYIWYLLNVCNYYFLTGMEYKSRRGLASSSHHIASSSQSVRYTLLSSCWMFQTFFLVKKDVCFRLTITFLMVCLKYPPLFFVLFVNHQTVAKMLIEWPGPVLPGEVVINLHDKRNGRGKKGNLFCMLCYLLESQCFTFLKDQLSSCN